MHKMKVLNCVCVLVVLILGQAFPVLATSVRQTAVDAVYDVHDVSLTPTQDSNHWYSSGLDVVYINGVRHFVVLWNTSPNWPSMPSTANGLTVSVYDETGALAMDIASYTDPLNTDGDSGNDVILYPQAVKLSPDGDRLWFSYTANSLSGTWNVSDWVCSIPWDSTLTTYPLAAATAEFQLAGNWEMEWGTGTGVQYKQVFVSGPLPAPYPAYNNGIMLFIAGSGLQPIVDCGGWSAGFAFDADGNLWYAEYGNYPTNYIYMWTAAQIDSAVASGGTTVLDTGSPLPIGPTVNIPIADGHGGNDAERDAAGNIYFSVNGGGAPGYQGNILRVTNTGLPPWPTTVTVVTQTQAAYDWQRSLAFDGYGDVTTPGRIEAGNRLYLDMDQGSQGVTPPTLVGISEVTDTDGDAVPDALDNCWQASNPAQTDGDIDGIGDVCDAAPSVFNDVDGDGIADVRDWSWDTPDDQILSVNELNAVIGSWFASPPRPDMDHNGDGLVSVFEMNFILTHWFQSQPLHPQWP